MVSNQITQGISISVEPVFNEKYSNLDKGQFIFEYQVTIENHTEFPVQLLRRTWDIFDSLSGHNHVEGEGVIGEQPVIYPNDAYTYRSYCDLSTDYGKMKGKYLMERKADGFRFFVDIPEFELVAPFKLN